MKILFDHQIFSYQRYGGISRYFTELFRNFTSLGIADWELAAEASDNEYLKGMNLTTLSHPGGLKKYLPALTNNYLIYRKNSQVSVRALKKGDYDIFHPTFYDPYFLELLKGKPYVLTIMDMTPELYPALFNRPDPYSQLVTMKWIKAKKKLAQNAARIIAISRNTRNDLVRLFGIPADSIDVIYLGDPGLGNIDTSTLEKPGYPYILYAGTRNHYKNFDWMVKHLSEFFRSRPGWKLFCAGGGQFTSEEMKLLSLHGLSERCVQMNQSDAGLAMLYRNASAFVYPSDYEGFGLPILEAISCGCPVVLPDRSCFPEIAGDAGCYYDAGDAGSFLAELERTVSDAQYAGRKIEMGRAELLRFRWADAARETADAYRKCQ